MARLDISSRRRRAIQGRLTRWYRRSRRDLPWRGTRDPYAVWVSEIMLQQTRVEAVKPYYARFLRRFPTVRALAGAPLGDVLKVWEGMGYYTRARNLHRAAQQLVKDFGGRLPDSAEALRKLPGVGRYTAGAIASIAFGLDEPVLDGNVTRVLCRLFRIEQLPASAKVQAHLWSLARQLIPAGAAGLFNQALMDLGATVCIPRSPRCADCPVETLCQARAAGVERTLPRKAKRARPLPHHTVVAGVIRKAGRILIDRRRPEGLLGGLWELPGGKVEKGESLPAALRREVREELAVAIAVGRQIAVVQHAYSHFRITLHAFECRWLSGRPRPIACDAVRWVRPNELPHYPFPAANHKVLAAMKRTFHHEGTKARRTEDK